MAALVVVPRVDVLEKFQFYFVVVVVVVVKYK